MVKRILVADTPEGDGRLSRILAGHDVVLARTLAQAHCALAAAPVDLVMIGARFDDSSMFDLLRRAQSPGRPVVCMRSEHFESPAIGIEGLEIAARALGCTLFLDLTWYADDAAGNGAVRALLDALLSPPPRP